MRTKLLPMTGGRTGGSPQPIKASTRRRRQGPQSPRNGVVPPLQWWRNLPAEAYSASHLMTLHRAIAGIGMVGEPRWADAAHGQPAAAVEVARRTVNAPEIPLPVVDLTMSTVLIAAIRGSTAAIALLITMIGKNAARSDRTRIQRSWRKRQRSALAKSAVAEGGQQ